MMEMACGIGGFIIGQMMYGSGIRKKAIPKKHVFFICHSFQMAMQHYGLAQVVRRKSKSFGTFPCHMTDAGAREKLFDGLPNPFHIADFRDWQVIQPNLKTV